MSSACWLPTSVVMPVVCGRPDFASRTAPTTSLRSAVHSACQPVVVVGYSMGGPVAQLLWQRHPDLVAGLVLCATSDRFAFGPTEGRVSCDACSRLLGGPG